MKRIFIGTNEFRSRWEEIGMTEEDLRELQNYLLENPEAGPVIQGTGGVRMIYIDFRARETMWLITAFAKNDQANLSQDEKKAIKAYVKGLVGGQGDE